MEKLNVKILKVGYLKTNCYIISDSKNAIIIDPGDNAELIIRESKTYDIKAVIYTHSHLDHIGALNTVCKYYKLKPNEFKNIPWKYEIISNPGHCNDSISIYFPSENMMFVGDFIFKGTIGRVDLPESNPVDMVVSLQQIKKYPIDTILYPGHGIQSILHDEIDMIDYFIKDLT